MQVGDLVQISPARNGHSIGIIVEQQPQNPYRFLVHWFNPNGLRVAKLVAWEHSDKLEVVNESR